MDNGIATSLSAIRQALLEKDNKSISIMSNENELSNQEKLKRCKEDLEDNDQEKWVYLGNGAFDVTMF